MTTASASFYAATAFSLASSLYVALAAVHVIRFSRTRRERSGNLPAVTILKPLCGVDVELYENLRSFCVQDYPVYQVIFGLRDAADPAAEIVRRLVQDLPEREIALVIDDRLAGPNLKVSNLANMDRASKYNLLVIADSDMRVQPDYLRSLVAPFQDPQVGAVTCLYRGTPVKGLASVLGAMAINEWFLPSVLFAVALEHIRYCFGATMAVRRAALQAIGGFGALSRYLADDHMLGRLIDEQGYKVRLSSYVVENIVLEETLGALLRHELRWARTIRSAKPIGYAFSFITYAIPMGLLAASVALLAKQTPAAVILPPFLALSARIGLHVAARSGLATTGRRRSQECSERWWLVPIRDLLSFLVWATSFLGHKVSWKNQNFTIGRGGMVTAGTRGGE
jgi:ceramide glucosyltransferase